MKLNKVFLKRRLKYKCDIDPQKGRLQDLSDRPHLQLPSTTAALAAALAAALPSTLRQPRIDTGGRGRGGGVGVAGGRGGREE